MGVNKEKYVNAILFFATHTPNLGRVKLNKLLYFLDFDHFEKYGNPVTGDLYENNELGPVPVSAEKFVSDMESKGLVEVVIEPVIDYVRYHIVPRVRYDASIFEPSEVEMLCAVAEKWANHTAKEMVIASHGEAPWIATKLGEIIPYPLAHYRGKFEEPSYDEEPRELISLSSGSRGS